MKIFCLVIIIFKTNYIILVIICSVFRNLVNLIPRLRVERGDFNSFGNISRIQKINTIKIILILYRTSLSKY